MTQDQLLAFINCLMCFSGLLLGLFLGLLFGVVRKRFARETDGKK